MAKNEEIYLAWQTVEFEHYEKGFGWYLTLTIIATLLIAYLIFTKDYFAAITLGIAYVIILFFARQKPQDVEVSITNKGIKFNAYMIPFASVRRFWIVDHAAAKDLHIETTAYLNRFLILPLREQDPDEVSYVLSRYIPESEPNRESIARRLARRLRF